MIKYLIYLIHIFFIFYSFLSMNYLIQLLVILSWNLNNNQCIFTQLEYYFFNQTLIDFFLIRSNNSNFTVPRYHRYTFYLIFIFNLFTTFF